jgi:hypothetical protein
MKSAPAHNVCAQVRAYAAAAIQAAANKQGAKVAEAQALVDACSAEAAQVRGLLPAQNTWFRGRLGVNNCNYLLHGQRPTAGCERCRTTWPLHATLAM